MSLKFNCLSQIFDFSVKRLVHLTNALSRNYSTIRKNSLQEQVGFQAKLSALQGFKTDHQAKILASWVERVKVTLGNRFDIHRELLLPEYNFLQCRT